MKNGKPKTGGNLSRRQKTLIHVAKAQVGLKDDEYRELLSSFGAASSKDLLQSQFDAVMRHFEKLGFIYEGKPKAAGGPVVSRQAEHKQRLLGEIERRLLVLGLPWKYADGMAKRMFMVAYALWLTPAQLRKVIAALQYHKQRKQPKTQNPEPRTDSETPENILAEMARDLEDIP